MKKQRTSLYFDIRYKYALHTTSFKVQPVSKNSLSNFRCLNYKYTQETGRELIKEEIESHAKTFSKLLEINQNTIRMDSMMISSSCRKLSRLEIVYSCLQRVLKEISDIDESIVPDKYKVYLKEGHRNQVIYRSKDTEVDQRLKTVIEDAVFIYDLFADTDHSGSEAFRNFARMLGEQTIRTKDSINIIPSKEISSESLQNPTDPDATYRKKGNKANIGYVANIVETFDDDNTMITSYDLQKNIYSDQQFSKDAIDNLGKQEEKLTIITDGAFYCEEISIKAAENNIEMIPTGLVGRTQESNLDYTGFVIAEPEASPGGAIIKAPFEMVVADLTGKHIYASAAILTMRNNHGRKNKKVSV